jgi:hypothetical protein
MKRKYSTLVPQNGTIPPIFMECQLAMMSVTLTQWYVDERLELPSVKVIGPSSSVFALQDSPPTADDTVTDFANLQLNPSPPRIRFGHTSIDSGTVDRAIQHSVLCRSRFSQGFLPQVHCLWFVNKHPEKVPPTSQCLPCSGIGGTSPGYRQTHQSCVCTISKI